MRIDPAGWPFIGAASTLALVPGLLINWTWGLPGVGLALLCLFFFRDPERVSTSGSDTVLSPADGRVMVAGNPAGQNVPPGTWQQVSIFLSPLDVHVNRIPMSGTVTHLEYHPGKFLPAYRVEAGDLNEYAEIHLERGAAKLVVRQIVGVLARRVVCRARVGDQVKAGDRYGVMKFGSRMDLFLPREAVLRVQVGDRVIAGVTPIATYEELA